jgi:hypothetical protein
VAAGQGDGSCSRNPLNEAVFIYQLRFQFAAFFRKINATKGKLMTTFAKSQTPFGRPAFSWTLYAMLKKPTAQIAHLVFANAQAKAEKTKRAILCQLR